MSYNQNDSHIENVQTQLEQVELLLEKYALLNSALDPENILIKDKTTITLSPPLLEIRHLLDGYHNADVAFILESLPIPERLIIWKLIIPERLGKLLIEVSEAVRDSLIPTMRDEEISEAAKVLGTDDLAYLAHDLSQNIMRNIFKSRSIEERERLREALSYSGDSVGALMNFNLIHVRDDISLQVASRYLRRYREIPNHTDQIFVVDRDAKFRGVLPINFIITNDPHKTVGSIMITNAYLLHPEDTADHAMQAFDRYNLVSAPVVDEDSKLIGRLTINVVLDFIRTKSERNLLNQVGLSETEDISSSAWRSAQNRWLWLALNLCAAFFASRIIDNFENTIGKFVALAALMPIVANTANTASNQTAMIITRALEFNQISPGIVRKLFVKELTLSALNGLVWGSASGIFAFILYHSLKLSFVLSGAMFLNFLLGTLSAIVAPFVIGKFDSNPVAGSGIIITAITNSGGFFIFLGLATIFLVN